MTPQQVAALGPAFAAYLRPFEDCFGQDRTREHLHTYCRGLLSDLPQRASNPSPWRRERPSAPCRSSSRTTSGIDALRDRLHHRVAEDLAAVPADNLGTVGLLDETSVVKKGKKTPGVQRQFAGRSASRRTAPSACISAWPGAATRPCSTPTCSCPNRGRRTGRVARRPASPTTWCTSPSGVWAWSRYRAMGNGIVLDWLTFDEGYGCRPAFLAELDVLAELRWLGEVPKSFRCLTARPRGKKPRKGWTGKRADRLRATARPFGIRRGGA